MPWGTLLASQWVSFTDAQGAGFLLKSGQNQTTSIQWMTKSDAIAKYQINESKASLVAKASDQWVEKQDLESGVTIYSFTIYTSASHPGSYGWYTANEACTGTRVYPLTVYSSSSSLIVGSALYFLSEGVYYPLQVNLFVGQTELWLYNGTSAEPFRLTSDSSNVIAQVGTCAPVYDTFTARYNNDSSTVCFAGTNTVYTSGGWGIGTVIYTDTGLTTPLTGYNYIVNTATNIIYEINVSTGAIQLDTGLTC